MLGTRESGWSLFDGRQLMEKTSKESKNYLKNAEMAMEDDYGMIDGIINNGKAPATEEKPSVLEKLKEQPVADTPKKSSGHSMERDME